MYEFDRVPDRRGTASLKWDFGARLAGRDGLLPLWVADMDFPAPPEIVEAVQARAAHGIYGYALEPESWFEAAQGWLQRRHGWRVEREWMVATPGVVPTISAAILAYSSPGDRIAIQPPVYHPFAHRIETNGREVAANPLVRDGDRYRMDLDGLAALLESGVRMLILCNPHNPGGRVWRRGELEQLAALCARFGAVIVSDEIHCDLVQPGLQHVPVARVSDEAAAITVTCFAATKSFNLAGLGGSIAIAADAQLRRRLAAAGRSQWPGVANCFGIAAAEAAWRHGDQWLGECLAYIRGNYGYLAKRLRQELPSARLFPLESTYLAWIDLGALALPDEVIRSRLLDAGVWLEEGRVFGAGGEGFQRLNLACPRATLAEGVDRMVRALGS
jgi:cystathionine beta-lyase